jgi:hypothetical protein
VEAFEFIYRLAALVRPGKPIRQKFQPKEADRLRGFIEWAIEKKHLDHETAKSARVMLSSFEGHVGSGLAELNDKLLDITKAAGVEVLPLNGPVLDTSLALYFKEIELGEFDRAVLATVLTKGRSLRDSGETDVDFCELRFGPVALGKANRSGTSRI